MRGRDKKKRKRAPSPFERLSDDLAQAKKHAGEPWPVGVSFEDLKVILRFAKWHRRWRLYHGMVKPGEVNLKDLERIDARRVRYYAELFGIDPAAVRENVHMHDAPNGGGRGERKAAKRELAARRKR